jgi:Na+/H+-dicarboxylate symporter
LNPTARVLLALIAGLVLGVVAAATGSRPLLAIAIGVEPVGTLWTNAVRMTVIPLVVALIVTGVTATADPRHLGRLGARALPLFVGLLLASGVFALLVAPLSLDRLHIPPEVAAGLRAGAAASDAAAGARQMPSLVQRIVEVVPANPIKAAADGALLPLVVFTLVFAFALTRLDVARRDPVVQLFQAVADAMLVVVRWVLVLAPIGIFALASGLGARMGTAAAGALLHYVATLSGVLLAFLLFLYPLTRLLGGVPLRRFAAAAAPAQAVAFSTRSSLAALPVMIASARERLGASPAITGFVLPLAVSVFRLNVPIAWVVGALFLSRLYGVPLGGAELAGLVVTSTLISFSVPGIPSSSLFLIAPVIVELGLPAEGVGILIAVDAVPDMFKTGLNVTSHLSAAAVLNRGEEAAA